MTAASHPGAELRATALLRLAQVLIGLTVALSAAFRVLHDLVLLVSVLSPGLGAARATLIGVAVLGSVLPAVLGAGAVALLPTIGRGRSGGPGRRVLAAGLMAAALLLPLVPTMLPVGAAFGVAAVLVNAVAPAAALLVWLAARGRLRFWWAAALPAAAEVTGVAVQTAAGTLGLVPFQLTSLVTVLLLVIGVVGGAWLAALLDGGHRAGSRSSAVAGATAPGA